MTRKRLALSSLLPLCVVGLAGPAAGNGRFPATVNVKFKPGATQRILVPATFGLLVSSDGGESFAHVCEAAIGYAGTYDPDYAVTASGAIYATSFEGLRVSRDGGCTFESLGGPLSPGEFISDVEVGPDGRIWATTATGGDTNDVYVSADGSAFSSAGLAQDAWWLSIKTSPGDATRLYLTGYRPDSDAPTALLYRSNDGGVSWEELPVTDLDLDVAAQSFVYLLAVSPHDPDLLFARVVGANPPLGDALYRSTDGGETWSKELDFADRLSAFVIRSDGRTIIAGSASPCLGESSQLDKGCVRISDDRGLSWHAASSQPKMACIGERSDGELYACGANFAPDMFAVGRSPDGEVWQKVLRFSDIVGPLECPADTIQATECATTAWPALCTMLGVCDSTGDDGSDRPHGDRATDDSTGYYCRVGPATLTTGVPMLLVLAVSARSCRRRRR